MTKLYWLIGKGYYQFADKEPESEKGSSVDDLCPSCSF